MNSSGRIEERLIPTQLEIPKWTAQEFERLVLDSNPKVAVFDCDGTLWGGDAGTGFMSWSIEQGDSMVAEVRKTDRIVQVGMQRRSSPVVKECKQLIDEGTLGEINLVRAEWYWNINLRPKSVLESKLDWERFVGPAPKHAFDVYRFRYWRYFWDYSGGNMTDQGTHLMDVIQWFTNSSQPTAAQCYGEVYRLKPGETPDTFCAIIEYPKFTCTWTLTYTNSFQNGWGIVFHGQKGTLELCEDGYRLYQEPWAGTRWARPEPVKEKQPGGVTRTVPHIQNFLECVRSRTQPNAPIEIGHQAVRTLHLANIAQRKKARAVLSEDGGRAVTSDPPRRDEQKKLSAISRQLSAPGVTPFAFC